MPLSDNAWLADIIASVEEGIVSIDEQLRVVLFNPAAERMFGRSRDEMIGQPLSALLSERSRAQHDQHIRNFAATGQTSRGMGRYGMIYGLRANGEEFPIEATISQAGTPHNKSFTVILRDISRRIEAEKELRKNYKLLDRIFATTHFCLVYLDRDFNFVRVNQAYADACGYPPWFFVGRNHFELYPGDEAEAIFRRVVATGEPFSVHANPFEFPDHPERGVTWWDWTLHPLRGEDGNVEGLLFALLDVTERKRSERDNAQLAAIVASSSDAIVSLDLNRTILSWNAAAERLFGYSAAEVIGRKGSLIVPADQEAQAAQRRKLLKEGLSLPSYDTVRLAKDGRRIDVAVTASPVRDSSGKMMGISLVFSDIRDRKRAEVERAQLAAIVESSNDAILTRGLDHTILSWNAAAERLFGWSAREAIGQSIDLILPPERPGKLRGFIECAGRGGTILPVETIHRRKDGARIPTQVTFSPIRDAQGNDVAYSLTVRDMTEIKRNEETLRSYAARLRELSYRLQEVGETERRAISRELHDRIGQGLTTLSLMAGTLDTRLSRESRVAVGTQLRDMQALLQSLVTQVRDLMAELRPPVLDDYGLLAALRHLVTELSRRTGIAVNLSGVDPYPRLPLIVETAMLRISQEALTNIVKHAHAKTVQISLNPASERVVLDIEDDGCGFDAGTMPGAGEHWGIITMRERAEAVGITFRLNSTPGAGTRIVLEAERAAT